MRRMETGVDLSVARDVPKINPLNQGFTVACSVTAQNIAERNGNIGMFMNSFRTARWERESTFNDLHPQPRT
jgi:hypothetical protein